MEKTPYEMADEADTNTAHILVELANQVRSSGRSYAHSRMAKNGLLVVNGKMKATQEKVKLSLAEVNHTKKLLDQYDTEADEERETIYGMRGLSRRKSWHNFKLLLSMVDNGLDIGYPESKKINVKQKTQGNGRCSVELDECDDFDSRSRKLSENPNPDSVKVASRTISIRRSCVIDESSSFIVPTAHTGFSFSVIHLLSAVRMSLVTEALNEDVGEDQRRYCEEKNLPSLSIDEIILIVRSKLGDLGLLQTQELLVDLVRGVLKTFSSKSSPLGAKNWKPLARYAKSIRKWYWTGPVSFHSPSIDDYAKIETASKAWDLPHSMLVKLVDSYANWLKTEMDVLKQIANLPTPPLELMQPLDSEERFKGFLAHKNIGTIGLSSDSVRAHFRREEALRYLVPDRAFSYTATDGKKSSVAPLRIGKARREHFMLRESRPSCVSIDSLVRDAAARLPDRVGTKVDVSTLMRDSQFIVDYLSEKQIRHVVGSALDRLHYEFDPCVKYDKLRHVWVYLHSEREEEDFGDHVVVPRKKFKLLEEPQDNELD